MCGRTCAQVPDHGFRTPRSLARTFPHCFFILFPIFFLATACVALRPSSHLSETEVQRDMLAGHRAESVLVLLSQGNYASITSLFDDQLRAQLSSSALKNMWQKIQSQYGDFQKASTPQLETLNDFSVTATLCSFAEADLLLKLVFTPSGEISGIFMSSPEKKTEKNLL